MTREEFLAKEAAGEAVLVDIRESQELAVVLY
jgi:rhodanese-related sulfurtransferase